MPTIKPAIFLVVTVITLSAMGPVYAQNNGHTKGKGIPGNHSPALARQRAMYKATYINEFRLTYLRQLLAKSYNNSPAIREVIKTDHSGFTEPLLPAADYALIDSLTTAANNQLKADSAQGINRAEGAWGKRPLSLIIEKLSGKWLDSLAATRYKKSGQTAWYTN